MHLPDVVAVHVLLRAPMDDPVGQLLPAAAAQHHSCQEGCSPSQSCSPHPAPSHPPGHLTPGALQASQQDLTPSLQASVPTPVGSGLLAAPHPAWGSPSPRLGEPWELQERPRCWRDEAGGCCPDPPALLKPQPRKKPRSSGASPIRGLWSGVKDSGRKGGLSPPGCVPLGWGLPRGQGSAHAPSPRPSPS